MDIERVEEAAPQVGIDSSSVGFFFRFLLVGLFCFLFFLLLPFLFGPLDGVFLHYPFYLLALVSFVCLFVCLFVFYF